MGARRPRPRAPARRERPDRGLSIDITSEQFAEVVVRDDGMGMSPRSDSPGLGLGLSLIDRLADETSAAGRPTASASSSG